MTDARLGEVLSGVDSIVPVDDREAVSIARLRIEVARLRRPFDEHADDVHLTASAFVLGTRGTVLHKHRRLGIWVQPGGHVDEGESAPQAALREATEETGLSLCHPPEGPTLLNVDVHPGPKGHTHLDLRYVLLGSDSDPDPPPGESQEVRWCSFPEADALAEPTLRAALRRLEETWEIHEVSWRAIVEEMTITEPGTR